MNILLTGGAGYIGSHTAVLLLEAGHQVVIFDNFCNSNVSTIAAIESIAGKALHYVEGDIRNTELLKDTLISNKIDAAIHFAGLKAVGESSKVPLQYYANNVQGTISLLEAMQECGVDKIVFSSSATVYGDPQYLPIDETHPTAPTNPYGQTKLQIEQILQDVCKADKNFRVANLRYFNPVGAHDSGLIGENPKGIPNNLMPYIAQVAVGALPFLNVYGNKYQTIDGSGVRDYIHIMDLAQGHLNALDYICTHQGWEVFNLGTGSGHSVFEVISSYERACKQKIPYQISSNRDGDIGACYANVAKAEGMLDWKAQRDIDDMCKTSWQFRNR